jgi:GNAT superfamily N-acetyltransferase
VEIVEETAAVLPEYARIPISFIVDRVVDVSDDLVLTERRLEHPYEKDYDALDGEAPLNWHARHDMSTWAFFVAREGGAVVGGATVRGETPGVAVLWDIRVLPGRRQHGIGAALFAAVEAWARERGCERLEVETQNINVPACRFYARMGCELHAIDRAAYPELPGEIRLLWRKPVRT